MNKRTLYIDCQFFQTPVWDRGMGRYAMSLIKNLYDLSDDLLFILIFSVKLPKNEAAMQMIISECPKAKIVELELQTTEQISYLEAARINKSALNDYVAMSKKSDSLFMIPCLFQEPTACVFPDNIGKCLVYYDSIPLLYYERYKTAINYENYMQRHVELFRADRIFTISKTVSDDLTLYYGMDNNDKSIVNIDGACIEGMFKDFKEPKLNIPENYILFSTSNDIRKNNQGAVEAFIKFNAGTKNGYKLVITSAFPDEQREVLENMTDHVIFTNNVSEAELAWLYKNAQAVLFASEYEGLGLPILEAVRIGKKVACSNIPVFREISDDAFYFFDPTDTNDMAEKLAQAVSGEQWTQKQRIYKNIDKRYTWVRTAGLVYDSLLSLTGALSTHFNKPKIAILSPTPDGYSAIGKLVQELHYSVAKYLDIHYYFENLKDKPAIQVRPNYLQYLTPCFPVEEFNALRYRDYDAVLYHIGNSEYHFLTILNALHLPGIAIFHDTVLREAFGEMVRLELMLPGRLEAELELDKMIGTTKAAFLTSVTNNQVKGITHSHYAKDALSKLVREGGPEIIQAALPVAVPSDTPEISKKVVNVGLAGILGTRKGLDIIDKLANDKSIVNKVVLHVFGFGMVDPQSIASLHHHENIRLSTNLSDLEYQSRLRELDILINYRSSYRGETSLTVLEAMRFGCVVVVNRDLGWFSELPNNAVAKITDEDELIQAVKRLIGSPEERRAISEQAREYVATNHRPNSYGRMLYDVITAQNEDLAKKRAHAAKIATSAEQLIEIHRRSNS